MCTNADTGGTTGPVETCAEGLELYREALARGGVAGDVPECLVLLGLLRPVDGAGTELVPVPPDIAAARLSRPVERAISEQQNALTDIHASLAGAQNVYRQAQQQAKAPLRLILGTAAISAALEEAVGACREELLTAQPGGGRSTELLTEALPRDLALQERGVRQRTLYQHAVRTHSPTLAYIERVSAKGAEIRTLNEVFERMIICDRSVAFIPDHRHERHTAALAVEHPGIIQFLVTSFEHQWVRAEPVVYRSAYQRPQLLTDETRRAVLQLVVTGYTNEAIATRLGISSRTVATHIQRAAELLGSRSRAQLCYLLARSGLLEDEHADRVAPSRS
ncbi:helix-turn-helix domain-containing protein [Streptomyces morookaense]|uniref:helix-turn-helix domain-containing protein n=1 Tax=Streptomyces morookaense TaxID=1970 RepID=UPI001E2E2ED2|nr:helix-turn-helix transcriptional regulator [Streptomyces morookaense]